MEFVDNEPFIEHFMEGASSVRTQLFIYLCRYGWVDNYHRPHVIRGDIWEQNRVRQFWELLYQIISMSDFGSGVS